MSAPDDPRLGLRAIVELARTNPDGLFLVALSAVFGALLLRGLPVIPGITALIAVLTTYIVLRVLTVMTGL